MYGTLSRLQPKAGQQQAVLDHLFRWEQEHLPHVSGYAGGYAVVRKIVERHGGTITAKSTEGEGSTFIISLPLC